MSDTLQSLLAMVSRNRSYLRRTRGRIHLRRVHL
jgi:hypothetical protein